MGEGTSKSVVVRGFPIVEGEQLENLKDKLQIYFQRVKESGGGDVDHLELIEPGLMKIQFVEGQATKNVLSRTNHQVSLFGKVYPLEVLPYLPEPTEPSQPHDARQPGSPAESNRGQEERPENETADQQSTGDHPRPVPYPGHTTEVPTVPTSQPCHSYGSISPTYPHPGYGPPTYPSSQGHYQIPGQPSTDIQEADSAQYPPRHPPSYETVDSSEQMQISATDSEGRPQSQEDSSASAAPSEGVPYPPQSLYPFPDPGGSHGEIHPHIHPQPPAGDKYPNPSFQGSFSHPQGPGPEQLPTYPGHMTPSKEKQLSGTDSDEGRPQAQKNSSAAASQSAVPSKGVPHPIYSLQNPYPGPPPEAYGDFYQHAHPHQPPAGVRYQSPTFQEPYHSPQASGHHHPPGLGPRHPGYPPWPAYPYISAQPPNQWHYLHQGTGHGQHLQQQMSGREPSKGGEKATILQISQPEDMETEEDASIQEVSESVLTCPGVQKQDRTARDHDSPMSVSPIAGSQLSLEPNEAKQPSMPQRVEEVKTGGQEEENEAMAIEVTGLPGNEFEKRRDVLYNYFKNRKRSGGGDISQFDVDSQRERVLITFKDKKAPKRVMEKPAHEIAKKRLKVEIVNPRRKLPVDPTRILLKGVGDPVDEEGLFFYLESMSKGEDEPSEVFYGKEAGTVMVVFTEPISDLDKLLSRCEENELEGQKISAEKVHATDCIQVTGIPPKTSKDKLFNYFKSTKRSGGGSVAEVQLDKDHRTALVFFDDYTVIERVLKRDHKIQNKTVTVEPFYTCLGATVTEAKTPPKEDIKRKQSEVDETVSSLKPEQVTLLAMSDFKDRMTSKFPKLQMTFDTSGSKVKFHGLLDEIQQTKVKIYETVQGVRSQRAKLSPTLMSFLASSKEPKQHLLGEYKRVSVVSVINTTTSEVEVCGLSTSDMEKAVSILKKTFQEQRLDVPEQSTPVLGTEEWKTTKTSLEQSAQGLLKISVESKADSGVTKILFTGESAFVKDIRDRVDKYLKVKTIHEQQVEADEGIIRFIKEHQATNLQVQLEKHQVSVHFEGSEERPTMSIKGNLDGIQKAGPILKSYTESVTSDQMSIKKPGMSKHFRKDAGRSTLQRVEKACKCVINIQDAMNKTPAPDPDTSAKNFTATSPTMEPQEKAVVNLDDGKKLVVWRDDITKHMTDVIVNPANARLAHTGGLAKAIVDAGGDIIQKFCNDYIQANGTLIPGQVVTSPPGRINTCQHILHTVGPIWSGGVKGEKNDLADAVYGSLEEAAKNNYRSIAIPAISSGIYGYPLKECTETIVATAVEYLKECSETSLEVIEFVNIDDQTADAFVDALESAFGQDRVEKSDYKFDQTTAIPPRAPRANRRRTRGRGRAPASLSTTAATFTPPPQPTDPVAEVGFRTPEGKAITAIQANIASQNVDVLVNTTTASLDLNTGAVSKAIRDLASSNLQNLVNTAKQSSGITSLTDGQILVTGSANLPCKQVIHCALCSWDGGQGNSEKVLRNIVKQCLQQAEKDNYKSIAIPAMGTGGLHFPHDVVAEAMFNEAVEHCRTNPSGSLSEIRFIVWEGDPKSIPAFNEVMAKYKALHNDNATHSRRGRRGGEGKTGHGRTTLPKSHFNPDDAACATPSLFSEVSTPVRGHLRMFIGDLTLNVRKGDLTKETTDCIVNSTNEQLDLTRGAVSQAICEAGGRNIIQRECANIVASGGLKDGIAVTGAGTMKCKKIIHAVAPDKTTDWKKVIINCLQTADSLGLRSIAFPALGTGILKVSAVHTANSMLDALQDFVLQYKPTSLNEVRVTIFQQDMVRTFHEEMRKRVGKPLPKTDKAAKPSGILGSIGRLAAAGLSYLTRGQTSNTDDQPIPSADNVVVLTIYADLADNLFEAKSMINKIMDEASKDKIIPAKIRLTEEQKEHVTRIAQRHDCSATFTRSNIRLQGREIDVMAASHDIKEFQRDFEIKINEEKHLSDKAELLLKTVQWYYVNDNEERQPYEPKVNYMIEKAYLANETGVDFKLEGEDFYIDFNTMKETEVGNFTAGAADVIRYEMDKEGTMKIPDTWTGISDEDQFKEVELHPSTEEYKKVHDEFMKSIATAAPTAGYSAITTAKVLKIQRIQNVTLWRQYNVKKKKMELDNTKSSQPVERILYHGTPHDPIPSINLTGFNRSYSGRNVGAAYGNGVYFAATASISGAKQYARPDANGHRYMYMARVLSGDMCQGQGNIIVPPAKDPRKPHITHDSVCDNTGNPQIIVIFYDTQAYPEYLITFTK